MLAASERSVNFYQMTWHNNTDDSHLLPTVMFTIVTVFQYKIDQLKEFIFF
jgi:hypothetical protein